MCNFKSAIVVRDEREKCGFRLHLSPWTESHSELEQIFSLRDTRDNLAKVEFSPESMATAHQVDTYRFTIDEQRTPSWFTDDMQKLVKERMAKYITSIIVTGELSILIGGQFIIAPGAKVSNVKQALVMAVLGNATVNDVWGNATVKDVRGNATVNGVWGNATVNDVRDNATVNGVWGNATVKDVRDNATVNGVWGNATVNDVWGNATVNDVWGNATVNDDHRIKK